jgi:hypothetical protein
VAFMQSRRAMLWLGIQTELDALAEATGFGRL